MATEARAKYHTRNMPTRRDDDTVKPNPRIPAALVEAVREIATRNRRSLNDQIVIALEEHVERERTRKPKARSPRRVARSR